MSDDLLLHLSSNSSNQSDQSLPTKMAKLEARLVGKAASSSSNPAMPVLLQQQALRPSVSPAVGSRITEEMMATTAQSSSSDSDDDVSSFAWHCRGLLFVMLVFVGNSLKAQNLNDD